MLRLEQVWHHFEVCRLVLNLPLHLYCFCPYLWQLCLSSSKDSFVCWLTLVSGNFSHLELYHSLNHFYPKSIAPSSCQPQHYHYIKFHNTPITTVSYVVRYFPLTFFFITLRHKHPRFISCCVLLWYNSALTLECNPPSQNNYLSYFTFSYIH